jgi:Protein of unknown function (DUF3618)
MAEPGGAVEVHGEVTMHGTVTKGDPDVLVAQIEQTREDLARTIDDLAGRVSPANNLRLLQQKVTEKISEQARKPEVQLGAAAVGMAVVGIVILRAWAKNRRRR